MKSRRTLAWLLVAVFIAVPIVEIYVIIQVGQAIGASWTIVLLIADTLFGGWLIKHEGSRAWRALQTSLSTGRMPHKELADGALILIGGTLILSPGFVLDVVGLLFILPFTRPLFRRLVTVLVARRVVVTTRRQGPGGGGPVIPGEVVDR